MYLLNTSSLKLQYFQNVYKVNYAILSHTWGEEEVSFDQLQSGSYKHLAGYRKIQAACDLSSEDGWNWVWIDTCCIDKRSSAELSEAINSMYNWYENARVCYAYLEDVSSITEHNATLMPKYKKTCKSFQESRWFSRGWTLQELLAPRLVIFYDRDWIQIGSKLSLEAEVSAATGIGIDHLRKPRGASAAQKLCWASRRETTRVEDEAYCLLGLFDVNLPLIYGEGRKAFRRLQEEIIDSYNDHSIFAWDDESASEAIEYVDSALSSMLADSPERFINSGSITQCGIDSGSHRPCSFVNRGVSMMLKHARSQNLIDLGLKVSAPERDFDTVGAENIVGSILDCQNPDGHRRVVWLGISPLSTETEIKAYRVIFQGQTFLDCQTLKHLRLRLNEHQFHIDSSNRPSELQYYARLSQFLAPFTILQIRSLSPRLSQLSLNQNDQYKPTTDGYFSLVYGQIFALLHHHYGRPEECAIYLSLCHRGAEYVLKVAWTEQKQEMFSFKLEIFNGLDESNRQIFTELLQNSGCTEVQLDPDTYLWAEISMTIDNEWIDNVQIGMWKIDLDINGTPRSVVLNPTFQSTLSTSVGSTHNQRGATIRPSRTKILLRTDRPRDTDTSPRLISNLDDMETFFFWQIEKTFPEPLFWKENPTRKSLPPGTVLPSHSLQTTQTSASLLPTRQRTPLLSDERASDP